VVVEDENTRCRTLIDGRVVAVRFGRSGKSEMPEHSLLETSGPLFEFSYIIFLLI